MALSDEFVFVLPVFGAPYFLGECKRDDEPGLELLQEAVDGSIEPVRDLMIAPTFAESEPRWAAITEMLKRKTTKVYANEEGSYGYSVNHATYQGNIVRAIKGGMKYYGCPHYFGDLAVVINRKSLQHLGIVLDCFRRTGKYDEDGAPTYKQPVYMTELN
jgi:hypothetical protein